MKEKEKNKETIANNNTLTRTNIMKSQVMFTLTFTTLGTH